MSYAGHYVYTMYLLIDLLLYNATGAVFQQVYDENKNTNNQYIGTKITKDGPMGGSFNTHRRKQC